jgi:hypothetical protein
MVNEISGLVDVFGAFSSNSGDSGRYLLCGSCFSYRIASFCLNNTFFG